MNEIAALFGTNVKLPAVTSIRREHLEAQPAWKFYAIM